MLQLLKQTYRVFVVRVIAICISRISERFRTVRCRYIIRLTSCKIVLVGLSSSSRSVELSSSSVLEFHDRSFVEPLVLFRSPKQILS